MQGGEQSRLIAGLDEVGYGALAGPLVIVVAAFPHDLLPLERVRDSKKCSKKERERLVEPILEAAIFVNFGFASAKTIDRVGVAEAWQMAACMALEGAPSFHKLIVDGDRGVSSYDGEQEVLPKADALRWQVGAASIVAKVMRDLEMEELASHFPGYGWAQNVGYGTAKHKDGLQRLGPSPLHRLLFLRKWMKKDRNERHLSKRRWRVASGPSSP
jgi:ribonuclease HII